MNYDSSNIAINLYDHIYENDLLPGRNLSINGYEIEISGDIIFNFNSNKIEYFKNAFKSLKLDGNEYNLLLDLLKGFEKNYENILNISAYPKTGGLNNIKQNLGNDRFDVFVSALFLYYNKKNSFILSSGSKNMNFENRQILKNFLDYFNKGSAKESLYNLMNYLYQVNDSDLIENLINNGMHHFDSVKSILDYFSLAIRFWENRAECIEKDDRFNAPNDEKTKIIKKEIDNAKEAIEELKTKVANVKKQEK